MTKLQSLQRRKSAVKHTEKLKVERKNKILEEIKLDEEIKAEFGSEEEEEEEEEDDMDDMDAFMSAAPGGGDESAPPDDEMASVNSIAMDTVDAALEQASEQRINSQQDDMDDDMEDDDMDDDDMDDDMDAFMSAAPGGGDESAPPDEEEKKVEEEKVVNTTEEKEEKEEEEKEKYTPTIVNVGRSLQYTTTKPPQMIPIGFHAMIHDAKNHVQVVLPSTNTCAVVVMGSGFHAANAFTPPIVGLVPDIGKDDTSSDEESNHGHIVFASIDEICASVSKATSVKIRKNPLDAREKELDPNDQQGRDALAAEREEQLSVEKESFKIWLQSLCPADATSTTRVTFVRNVYPMDEKTGTLSEVSAKPVWVTGLGVESAIDCGSGKVALVDGTLGTQIGGNKSWLTNDTDPPWSQEDVESNAKMIAKLRDENVTGGATTQDGSLASPPTLAYGTGNWRKVHMEKIWPKFQTECAKYNINFNLLSGELEAKYGGISALKLAAPFASSMENWIVLEMGGGSTQISSFEQVRSGVEEEGKDKKEEEAAVVVEEEEEEDDDDEDDMDDFMMMGSGGGGDESAPPGEEDEETMSNDLTIDSSEDPLDSSEELKQQLSDIQSMIGEEASIDVKDMTKVEAESQATDMLSKMAEDFIMADDFELDPALDGTDEGAYEVLQSELAKLEQELSL